MSLPAKSDASLTDNKPLAVIKIGGDVLLDESQRLGLVKNLQGILSQGWDVVMLHGGGPQVSTFQESLGLKAQKVAGRRITQPADLELVKQVICGQLNVDLVSLLQSHNINAFGCHGASGKLIVAERRPPIVMAGSGSEKIDFGEVGDVKLINITVLQCLLKAGFLPVIATLGIGENGDIYNINADTTVTKLALEFQADLLIFVTGVGGIFADLNDPSTRFSELNKESAQHYIDSGVITDGMIAKVEEALSLVELGVGAIAITNTLNSDAFASMTRKETGFGTRIVR